MCKSSNGDVSKLSAERHPIKSHRITIEINRKKLNPLKSRHFLVSPEKKSHDRQLRSCRRSQGKSASGPRYLWWYLWRDSENIVSIYWTRKGFQYCDIVDGRRRRRSDTSVDKWFIHVYPMFFGVSTIQSRVDFFFRQYGIPCGYFLGMYWTKGKIDISSTKKTWCSGEKKIWGKGYT